MLTDHIGDFPLYILEDADDDLSAIDEPFNYVVRFKTERDADDNEITKGSGTCNNIPCSMCTLSEQCEDGKHKTQAVVLAAKERVPELFI